MLNIPELQWEDLLSISSPLIGVPQNLHCSSGNLSQRSAWWGVAFTLESMKIAKGDQKIWGTF